MCANSQSEAIESWLTIQNHQEEVSGQVLISYKWEEINDDQTIEDIEKIVDWISNMPIQESPETAKDSESEDSENDFEEENFELDDFNEKDSSDDSSLGWNLDSSEEEAPPKKTPPKRETSNMVEAIDDFKGKDHTYLTFKKGDLIQVIKEGKRWNKGCLENSSKFGWFHFKNPFFF